MKLDKICRTCLSEKANLKPLFEACLANMLMSCASIQVMEGDGLPHQICTQCLQNISRSFTFKNLCEKSDHTLRQYLNTLQTLHTPIQSIINDVKTDLFGNSEVLQQSSIFQDIFNDATTQSLVENFTNQNASTVVSDLAETMQSLQTIAEQCLPETWDTNAQLVSCSNNSQETNMNAFSLTGLYKCQYCEDMFKDEWCLSDHLKIHTGQNKYFCTICSNIYDTADELDSHLIDHTIEKATRELDAVKNSPPKVFCNICDKQFNDSRFLRKHLKDVHFISSDDCMENERKYMCNICGKGYKQNKMLAIHMRNHTGEKPHRCDICGRTFALSSSLHKHRNIHNNEKKFECHVCSKRFNQTSNLNSHMLIHAGEKSYMCSICQKTFYTNSNLEVHMRIHTGIKPFICNCCENSFITSTQLKKHMLIHTGEKPYPCWQCGKTFRRKETRDTHMRYHTGERPYACNICTKKYIAASHLRVHMKTHTNDRKHECIICLKKFMDAKTLKHHIMTHTGQKPYSCLACGKRFTQASGLKVHARNCQKQSM